MKPVRIIIFAKAPVPGFAKTRLIPALGAQAAADLARRMLLDTVQNALAARLGLVELCVTPSITDPAWQVCAIPHEVQCSEQGEGDLGGKMARAAQRAITREESILLIGTDCPELNVAALRQAAAALQINDAAMFPTADGGYALLGLNRYHPSLFTNIVWSTDSVASVTKGRFAQLGWQLECLSTLHDIDEASDLQWLPAGWIAS